MSVGGELGNDCGSGGGGVRKDGVEEFSFVALMKICEEFRCSKNKMIVVVMAVRRKWHVMCN